MYICLSMYMRIFMKETVSIGRNVAEFILTSLNIEKNESYKKSIIIGICRNAYPF